MALEMDILIVMKQTSSPIPMVSIVDFLYEILSSPSRQMYFPKDVIQKSLENLLLKGRIILMILPSQVRYFCLVEKLPAGKDRTWFQASIHTGINQQILYRAVSF